MTRDMHQTKEDRLLWGIGSNLEDLGDWDESMAADMAKAEGIALEEDHWTVIHYLRAQYDAHGDAVSARKLIKDLEERFEDQGGRRYLFRLFPGGAIAQGSRFGGLPEPRGTSDPSFGYVH